MPVFTFEKISPPAPLPGAANKPAARRPQGVIAQLVNRFVETRVKRTLGEEKAVIGGREHHSAG